MISRRAVLGAGATAGAALTGGCLGFVLGSEPLTFEAGRAAPADEALEETGFATDRIEERTREELLDVGVERELRATVWLSRYVRDVSVDGGESGQGASAATEAFTAVSLPGMEVLGSRRNPVVDMDAAELLDEFAGELRSDSGELTDVSYRDSHDLEILGEDRTVDVFDARAEGDGGSRALTVEVAVVDHDGDVLVLAGTYPDAATDGGRRTATLMASVEHPVE